MSVRSIWVSPRHDGGWKVKDTDNSKASKITSTKQEAIDFAKDLAKSKHTELIVQNLDGKISSKDSYGKDSCPPKDKEY